LKDNIPKWCSHTQTEIQGFFGPYRFLSNFWESPITLDGIPFLNGEAAYQAQKATDPDVKKHFALLEAGPAKALGQKIDLRPDWESVKTFEMERVTLAKFSQNPELKNKLLGTGNRLIVERNSWGDRVWGTDLQDRGENRLGKILMKVREILRHKSTPETAP
jgi:ribA/ribD-fused uncharacterized protein